VKILAVSLVAAIATVGGVGGAGGARAAARGVPAPALRLERGAVARHQLVAVARDIEVEGDALADVAALQGSVIVTGHVQGDVIVIGGNARLGPRASVDGDISVMGGTIEADPGARIGGRSVSYPNASPTFMTFVEGPSLGLAATSPLVLGAKVALLAAWAALLLLLFAASGRQMLETADDVRREPFLSFLTGLTGVAALVLTALAFSIFLGGLAWAPMLALVALLLVVLKLWGMVAVFHALGDWLAVHLLHRSLRPLNAATLGLLLMGAVKFIPYVGVWARWRRSSGAARSGSRSPERQHRRLRPGQGRGRGGAEGCRLLLRQHAESLQVTI
jgi:hypothetical protein